MPASMTQVKDDFDRLALLSEEHGWSHNDHYHTFLLRHLPPICRESLDLGCGTGAFARLLAARSSRVVGVDLSPEMVRVARQRSVSYPNIEYLVADVMRSPFQRERFDCIASIATLHHLPMQQVLQMMKQALRPCGRLLILDIYRPQTVSDLMLSLIASPVNLALRLAKSRRLREPREIRDAWAEHGRFDVYPTIREVRRVCSAMLPGATVRRFLLWRYSIVWDKPGSTYSDAGRYHR